MVFSPLEQAAKKINKNNNKETRIIAGRGLKERLKFILPILIPLNQLDFNFILKPG
ncbi:MAG: hypothetical protein H5U05_08970 [Candidatus Aminicenantes bacterium]|nr:hypothetical protein [Candidatus Aminicenantes bacterium]